MRAFPLVLLVAVVPVVTNVHEAAGQGAACRKIDTGCECRGRSVGIGGACARYCGGCCYGHGGHPADWVNCECHGSYNYPVPPLYSYHWRGMYSRPLMTEYQSPWRYPPLKPYFREPSPGEAQYYNTAPAGDYKTNPHGDHKNAPAGDNVDVEESGVPEIGNREFGPAPRRDQQGLIYTF